MPPAVRAQPETHNRQTSKGRQINRQFLLPLSSTLSLIFISWSMVGNGSPWLGLLGSACSGGSHCPFWTDGSTIVGSGTGLGSGAKTSVIVVQVRVKLGIQIISHRGEKCNNPARACSLSRGGVVVVRRELTACLRERNQRTRESPWSTTHTRERGRRLQHAHSN